MSPQDVSLQDVMPVMIAFARYFTRPLCPQCGNEQLVPERSAFAGEGRVCHAWICESCGHDFCTAVELGRVAA